MLFILNFDNALSIHSTRDSAWRAAAHALVCRLKSLSFRSIDFLSNSDISAIVAELRWDNTPHFIGAIRAYQHIHNRNNKEYYFDCFVAQGEIDEHNVSELDLLGFPA